MRSAGFLFLVALTLSLAVTPLCRTIARRLGWVDAPKQDRWHRRPTAMLGGAAIFLTVDLLAVILGLASTFPLLLGAGAVMFVLGLIDDRVSLKPSTKLVVEIAVASAFLFFGYRLQWTRSLTIDAVLTFGWIVCVTNAFNLLDNMDGLCGGVALIAGGAMLAAFLGTTTASYVAVLMGATAGFLAYNINPASIFMGDSGSLFLGLNLAVLTLSIAGAGGVGRANVVSIVAAPVLILLIPILDSTLVTVVRLMSGRLPSQGGRDHSSHRLVAIGLSERAAVAVLWTLAAAGGVIAFAARRFSTEWSGPLAAVFILAVVIFAAYLAQVRVYEHVDAEAAGPKITALVAELMYKRHIAQVLLDACLITIAYYTAYRLRFENDAWGTNFPFFIRSYPLAVGIQIVALFAVQAYRGVWRHFGLMDAVTLVKGVLLGTVSLMVALLVLYRFDNFSRAVFVVYAALLVLLFLGSRASFRLMTEFIARRHEGGQRLIICGAALGASATRDVLNPRLGATRLIGFIDDDPARQGRNIQGYPVLGGYDALTALIRSGSVDSIVLTDDSIRGDSLERLEVLCFEHGVMLSRLRIGLEELIPNA